ncbi:hypothetical protein FFLO_00297 [Filobasidium floriforme]|uniref:Cytochrome c oxidase assembly protein COX20, mitochondrial n=1 Tax=Filobasidium floriforme TaxID=5210 RepID=A0A8K0NVV2_9TREE|nr:uncharacterized protein HD553DRAFT_343381 [Filobasidium floriforme]KAG7575478.1 hypothetical protein FFLO_00297 [Filobasidium floriforme]KAH8082615.1 hypothetical protein HD553DRAFT_343381 [Filobasidium floriforme]
MSKRTDEPKEVLNISAGNQPITEDPKPLKPEDRRTGDFKQDFWSAFRRIRPIDDLQSIGTIPCARESLLSGIAGGFGIGSVRYISKRMVGTATNWAVGSFVGISILMWENCRRKRAKELAQMKLIEKQFAHRHVSKLKRKDGSIPETSSSQGETPTSAPIV